MLKECYYDVCESAYVGCFLPPQSQSPTSATLVKKSLDTPPKTEKPGK